MTSKLNRLLDERLADGFNDELGHVGERRQLGNGHGDVADVFGGKNLRAMLMLGGTGRSSEWAY